MLKYRVASPDWGVVLTAILCIPPLSSRVERHGLSFEVGNGREKRRVLEKVKSMLCACA